jgi:alpha-1,3-rhamnosyl/mannosyltransferase
MKHPISPTQPLRVAVDVSALFVTKAGTARYIRGLLSGFRQLGADTPEVEEIAWPVENFDYRQPRRLLRTAYRELIWARSVAPKILRKGEFDVFLSPAGWMVKPPAGLPHVVTLLDLALLRHPERFRPWHLKSGLRRLEKIQKADAILTISEFTANEAMKYLGLPAKKLFPVLLGCDFDSSAVETVPSGFTIPSEFFLFVGSLEPGKNLSLLRDAYIEAEQLGKHLPPLVVVGVRWAGVLQEGEWPANWIYAGGLKDSEMIGLYRRALALVFPSKYEGFGLPPLEAMNLGCPVVCSPLASLPEVVGDAALFAEQTPSAYRMAMEQIAASEELRAKLREKGGINARRFSWRKCASETLEVLKLVTGAAETVS